MRTLSDKRLEAHLNIKPALDGLSDANLRKALEQHTTPTSTGARQSLVVVDGKPVHVKRITLSKLEHDNPLSTANLFQLPMSFQYGVNSRGFGAWRELAASIMTMDWVLKGETAHFPMLHHHRVMTLETRPDPMSEAELDAFVAYWDGDERIRERVTSVAMGKHELVMCFEYLPHVLARRADASDPSAVCDLIRSAFVTLDLMRQHGITHFDAHWENVLTDGRGLYLSDMGLANCEHFDLDDEERTFLRRHQSTYDYALFARGVCGLIGRMPGGSDELIARVFGAQNPHAEAESVGVHPALARLIADFSELAFLMFRFMKAVVTNKATPYPRLELEQALERTRLRAWR